ncbi:MAG: SRPBCC family protein [Chloroflexota bacterium]
MNILDHRILIPKSPQIVWEHLSDLSKNQTWQVNYINLSYLTSKHEGTGVRWRYTTNDGHDYVAETIAWYDGLGYEYTLVDGISFKQNKGRIRLQEIAEGTIVQWTFSYEIGGFLGGVRNALTLKRQIEGVMVDSLKMLWRVLNKSNDERDREAKSILRQGLDYEARAQYKPRHPSVKSETATTAPVSVSGIVEPPISDEDTRPRMPAVVDTPTTSEPENETAEPAFLVGLPPEASAKPLSSPDKIEIVAVEGAAPSTAAETSEHPAVVLEAPTSAEAEIQFSEAFQDASEFVNPPGILPEQLVIVGIEPDHDAPQPPTAPDAHEEVVTEAPLRFTTSDTTLLSNKAVVLPEPLPAATDTGEVSVFDLFGIPKPSETQEMRPVTTAASPVTATVQSLVIGGDTVRKTGLRVNLRRKRVRVRRPH